MNSVTFLSVASLFFSIFVVFVNGWTDAPSAVFSIVSSGVLKLWQGVLFSAAFNFLGVLIFSLVNSRVGESILSLVEFESELASKIACLSCFSTVVVFGVVAWAFGMPSSESHALIASLAGASLVFGRFSIEFVTRFGKIIVFMLFSCALSFIISYFFSKAVRKKKLPYKKLLFLSSGALSFMHGGQDGQKFIAIIMLLSGVHLKGPPLYSIFLVSIVMALSTLLGGKRIMKSLSSSIEKCDTPLAFSSDFASFFTLLVCSIIGMPISTGNVKSISLVGSSIANNKSVNKKIITEILATSVITFPACFILGIVFSKIFSAIFLG